MQVQQVEMIQYTQSSTGATGIPTKLLIKTLLFTNDLYFYHGAKYALWQQL